MSYNENDLQQSSLLKKTKDSVNEIIKYNDQFKNGAEYPGQQIDEIQIRQFLIPVYDKIYEIKDNLNKFNEYTQNPNNDIPNEKINYLNSLHTNIVYNKSNIEDTINYMKEKIENVHYEQISREFEELTFMLENLKDEMNNLVDEFNSKYDNILREKKRQQIAQDLLNGSYNQAPNNNLKNDILNKGNDLHVHKAIDDIDNINYYNYKNDIAEWDLDKENLMLKYLEDKRNAINNLPKLVAPSEKVYFKYNLKDPNKDANNVNSKINLDDNKNNIQNSNNIDNDINTNSNPITENKNINFDTNKNNKEIKPSQNLNKKQNNINSNNQKINGSKKTIPKKNNKSYQNYMIDNEDQPSEKPKVSPSEAMKNFQSIMSGKTSQFVYDQPKKTNQKRGFSTGPTKADYLRNIQPRSNGSLVTLQDFHRKKPQVVRNPNKNYIPKPNNFKVGRYPNENEEEKLNKFVNQNPVRPQKKKSSLKQKEFFPNPENLEEQIQKIVEMNIKKILSSQKLDRSIRSNRSEKGGNNDELLKILIEKFDDLETAIRETNNNRGYQHEEDINNVLANEIYNKISSQLNSNINIKINDQPQYQPQYIPVQPQQPPVIEKKEEPKNIPLFENNNKISFDELDKQFPAPHKINLSEYEISNTSEYIDDSLINKNKDININEKNIEINRINIKENNYYENNVNNNEIDNSLSKGEVVSESNEDSEIVDNKKNYYNTYNKNGFIKNKTGNDLQMLKYFNENLPGQIINKNDNLNNYNEYEKSEGEITNSYINNKEEVNLDNNDALKKYSLYSSDEYNAFKNNFMEEMNKNKTGSSFFGSNYNNFNNTYTQMRPQESNQKLNNTFGCLRLVRTSNKDVDDIIRKQQIIQSKMDKLNNNTISEMPDQEKMQSIVDNKGRNNNNNINMQTNDDGYPEGEVRSDDSY